jgi:hypothetical protein
MCGVTIMFRRAPERVASGQRLVRKDINDGACEMLFLQRVQEIARHQMFTLSDVDQLRDARQAPKRARPEDAARFFGERQQAHKDIGAAEERVEGRRARERRDARQVFWPPRPAARGEAEAVKVGRDTAANLAEPHHANRAHVDGACWS